MQAVRRHPLASGGSSGERAITHRPPEPGVREQRRYPGASPKEHKIEKPRIARAEERANAMYRQSQEQRQEVLREQKRLHGEHEIHQERRVRDAPAHRRAGCPDEEHI